MQGQQQHLTADGRVGDGASRSNNGAALTEERHPIPEAPVPNVVLESPRHISIRALNYGYEVTVGCQNLAIESRRKLVDLLDRYLTDWNQTEVEYRTGRLL